MLTFAEVVIPGLTRSPGWMQRCNGPGSRIKSGMTAGFGEGRGGYSAATTSSSASLSG